MVQCDPTSVFVITENIKKERKTILKIRKSEEAQDIMETRQIKIIFKYCEKNIIQNEAKRSTKIKHRNERSCGIITEEATSKNILKICATLQKFAGAY